MTARDWVPSCRDSASFLPTPGPALALAIVFVATSILGCANSATSSPVGRELDLTEERRLAVFDPPADHFMHVTWRVYTKDGKVLELPSYYQLSTAVPQPVMRRMEDGALEVLLPKRLYVVPEDWMQIEYMFSLGVYDTTYYNYIRASYVSTVVVKLSDPMDGPWATMK